jgi:hypothetical protein
MSLLKSNVRLGDALEIADALAISGGLQALEKFDQGTTVLGVKQRADNSFA